MVNYLLIDFEKNTCEIDSSNLLGTNIGFKNMKRNKTQKELLETVKAYLREVNKGYE